MKDSQRDSRGECVCPPQRYLRIPAWARRWLWRILIAGLAVEIAARALSIATGEPDPGHMWLLDLVRLLAGVGF